MGKENAIKKAMMLCEIGCPIDVETALQLMELYHGKTRKELCEITVSDRQQGDNWFYRKYKEAQKNKRD